MKKYFEILGVGENASRAEIEEAYKTLKAKYSEDRFKEGEEGNDASRRLMDLEEAYSEISSIFIPKENIFVSDGAGAEYDAYAAIDAMIKQGRLEEAQNALDNMSQRRGEWHYLQSIVFYKRGWYGECRDQLKIALSMEPLNPKFRTAAEKLELFLGNVRVENNMGPGNPNIYSQGYDPRNNSACNNPGNCCYPLCCCSPFCC